MGHRRNPLADVLVRFVVAIAIAALAGCSKPPKIAALAPDAVVLAFGDSLTFGTGANEDESYPAHLARLIGRKVASAGVPGEVSGEGLKRLPAVLDEHEPRLLILCHGGNDFLRRLSKQQVASNVRSMIQLAKSRGIDVLLIGTPEPGFGVTPPGFYADIARELGIPYEEDVIGRILRDSSLKSDPIHPNARGYRMLAEQVAVLLKKSGAL